MATQVEAIAAFDTNCDRFLSEGQSVTIVVTEDNQTKGIIKIQNSQPNRYHKLMININIFRISDKKNGYFTKKKSGKH